MKVIRFDDPLAVRLLSSGEVLAFPTETVFGLGVKANDKMAFTKLVEVKRRPENKPFTLMASCLEEVEQYAILDEAIKKVVSVFCPGPLTIIVKAKKDIPEHIDLKSGKIGFRIPDLKPLLELIKKVGVPLLVPSANRSGEKPCLSSIEVKKEFKDDIMAVVEGNLSKDSLPSTIIDLSNPGELKLIRQGELSIEKIEEVYYEACNRL